MGAAATLPQMVDAIIVTMTGGGGSTLVATEAAAHVGDASEGGGVLCGGVPRDIMRVGYTHLGVRW